MKTDWKKKLLIILAITTSIILTFDSLYISFIQFNKSIKIADNLNIRSDSISKVIQFNESNVEFENNIPPIIIVPQKEIETPQAVAWLFLKSSGELKTGNFENYKIFFNQKENGKPYFIYYISITSLNDDQNNVSINLEDLNGNEISKVITINKFPSNILGTWDERKEEVLPDGDDLLTLIDKYYGLAYTYEPIDLVDLSEYGIVSTNGSKLLRKVLIEDLEKLMDDAQKDGVYLYVLSAYRSYNTQLNLYNQTLNKEGEEYTLKYAAVPGHSEHQLGTAIDFTSSEMLEGKYKDFKRTKASEWLSENANKYGFVMSYPLKSYEQNGFNHEPWHYRYVGINSANKIKESGKIPIEYIREFFKNKYE